MIGKCDVCGKQKDVEVYCSTIVAMSFAYCEDCLKAGAEPYWSIVQGISYAGKYPDDIDENYQEIIRNTLKRLNISEEKYIKDLKFFRDSESKTCNDCANFVGCGDWNLCCSKKPDLCYEDTLACTDFFEEKTK